MKPEPSPELIKAAFDRLGGIEGAEQFLRGELKLARLKYDIDCDADPFVPDGWSVEEHILQGKLRWDAGRDVELFLANDQKSGKYLSYAELNMRLDGRPVLNTNVLDFLLKHPELIPEEWKDLRVLFWGTIYRDSDGALSVRCLHLDYNRHVCCTCHCTNPCDHVCPDCLCWDWDYNKLDNVFGPQHPALIVRK